MMIKKFVLPEGALNKNQIMSLILDSSDCELTTNGDQGDLAGYAEMNFGPKIFDEGFDRYSDDEIQRWYYGEYIENREADIKLGFDRGQG